MPWYLLGGEGGKRVFSHFHPFYFNLGLKACTTTKSKINLCYFKLCVCEYVCVEVRTHMCMYVCMSVWRYAHTHVSALEHACVERTRECIRACLCGGMYAHASAGTHRGQRPFIPGT